MPDAEGESGLRAKGWNTERQANRGWNKIPHQRPEMEEDKGPGFLFRDQKWRRIRDQNRCKVIFGNLPLHKH